MEDVCFFALCLVLWFVRNASPLLMVLGLSVGPFLNFLGSVLLACGSTVHEDSCV